MVVFLKAATNNQASTVLNVFKEAVNSFGLPSGLHCDKGGENMQVASICWRNVALTEAVCWLEGQSIIRGLKGFGHSSLQPCNFLLIQSILMTLCRF